jgi:hypothetical protein
MEAQVAALPCIIIDLLIFTTIHAQTQQEFKMAADPVYATVNSPKNIKSDGVFCNSECQCCSLTKSDVQALENEVKLMTEIINILRDELK